MQPAVLSRDEFAFLRTWMAANPAALPAEVRTLMSRVCELYHRLATDKAASRDVLRTLQMAMGLIPTSERGSQLLEKR